MSILANTAHHTLVLRGSFAGSTSALGRLFGAPGSRPFPVVADLSLGSWHAHSVASQFAAQLGERSPSIGCDGSRTPPRRGSSYADLVAYGIDAESLGNPVVDTTLTFARLVAERSRRQAIVAAVIMPRFGAAWEDEDVLFIEFLARELGADAIRLLCCEPAPGVLPAGWSAEWEDDPAPALRCSPDMLSLFPGTLSPELAATGVFTRQVRSVALPSGWHIVAPEARRDPGTVSRLEWDRLAVVARDVAPHLAAYAQYHGNNLYVDPRALTEEAWTQFAAGGTALALRYLQRVADCAATPVDGAIAQMQMQGMRIAHLRFGEAATQPQPDATLPTPIRAFLLQAKGWGAVQAGAAGAARPLLDDAQRLAADGPGPGREYLYLLNIKALAEVRCGQVEEALRIEQEIEHHLTVLQPYDWQLAYINAINQARLHKRLREWSRAEAYYARAFDTTSGLRSESDAVYMNVCLAALADAAGQRETALAAWTRASLHWVASTRPEALTWRIGQAIAGAQPVEFGNRRCLQMAGDISSALLHRLQGAAQACAVVPALCVPVRLRHFMRVEELPADRELHSAVGAAGCSVLTATTGVAAVDRDESSTRLREWLTRWIERAAPQLSGDTLIVDARCGKEVATSLEELLDTCVRNDVTVAYCAGERMDLDRDAMRALRHASVVRVGTGVATVDHDGAGTVRFKRYRPPLTLTAAEGDLVRALGRGGVVPATLALIRSLENARVVECVVGQKACEAAGIRLRSNAS